MMGSGDTDPMTTTSGYRPGITGRGLTADARIPAMVWGQGLRRPDLGSCRSPLQGWAEEWTIVRILQEAYAMGFLQGTGVCAQCMPEASLILLSNAPLLAQDG